MQNQLPLALNSSIRLDLPPFVLEALGRLETAGYEAFLVGGALRDGLLGRPCHDFDLCTDALPEEMLRCFEDERLIPTGLKHGTVTLLLAGQHLEITTYRQDGHYSDHRRPDSVRFTRSLREDLARRDFTINALAYHPRSGLVDYFGGLDDLRNKRIRTVGDPVRRFEEDALRLLRAPRLAAQLGFTVDSKTASALLQQKELLCHVSVERIAAELRKLLCAPAVFNVLMDFWELIAVALPELAPLYNYAQNNPHHRYPLHEHTARCVELTPDKVALRLAALFHDAGKPDCRTTDGRGIAHYYSHARRSAEIAAAALSRLRYPNRLRKKVTTLILHHSDPMDLDERVLRKRLARLGEEDFFDLLQVKRADLFAQGTKPERAERLDELASAARQILSEKPCLQRKDLALNGHDLKALGLSGVEIGRALEQLLEDVLNGRLENTRAALLASLDQTKPVSGHR